MIIPAADFHIHSTYCDGDASPVELAETALRRGFTAIGFSSHAAWPMKMDCELSPAEYETYAKEIRHLQEIYRGRLDIFLGFEMDYIPPVTSPDHPYYRTLRPDYSIGSVHYVFNHDRPELGIIAVDDKTEKVAEGIRDVFGGDVRKAVQTYFATEREMISKCSFDIIGHIDLIRKRNRELKLFNEDDSWYKSEVKATAEAAAKSGRFVEINTGGMARNTVDTPYPSPYMLEILNSLSVPIVFDSDAHKPEHMGYGFDSAAAAAVKAGYKEAFVLTESGWKARPLY